MGQKSDRWLLAGAGLVVALLIIDAVIAHRSLRDVESDMSWVAQSHIVREMTSDLLRTFVDAESGQRGFLLTDREEFLEPYRKARLQVDSKLAALKAHVPPHSPHIERLRKLEVQGKRLMENLEQGIFKRRGGMDDLAAQAAIEDVGQQMDEIRKLIAEMRRDELNLLARRERRSSEAYQSALVSSLLAPVLGLLWFAAFVVLLRRTLDQRSQAATSVQEEKERLRITLASIGDAVIATDTRGLVTLVNPVAEQLTGWSQLDASGRPVSEVFRMIHSERRTALANPVEAVLRSGVSLALSSQATLVSRDGVERPIAESAAPIRNTAGTVTGAVLVFRDVTAQANEEKERAGIARLTELRADVSTALAQSDDLAVVLQACADALLKHLDATLTRIWTISDAKQALELAASAGSYNSFDGTHSLIPIGKSMVGRVAKTRQPLLTNDVYEDLSVSDQEWAARESMVAFAGYPLLVEGRIVGVLALFAHHTLGDSVLADLATVSASIAQCIERRRTDELRRQSEEQFRMLADNMAQFAWMCDQRGDMSWYNQRWFDYTGLTAAQSKGRGWEQAVDPRHLSRVVENFSKCLERGAAWEDTFPLRGRDGAYRWFLSRAVPISKPDGQILLWFGTNTDVTAQREGEAALRSSEERFRQLADAMPQIVWVAGAQGQHEYFNRRWYNYTGMTAATLVSESWISPIHPDDKQQAVDRWALALKSAEPYDIEYRLRRDDGHYRWFLCRALPVLDAAGRVEKWFGTSTDIDDSKQVEEALRRSEAFVRGVVESSPDSVHVLDSQGRMQWMNEIGLELFGVTDFESIRNESWLTQWGTDVEESEIQAAIATARAGGTGRFRCRCRRDVAPWLDVAVTQIPGPDTQPERLLAVCRDITAQREAEMRVRENEAHLRRIIDSMFAFVSIITPDGTLVETNRAPLEIAGLTREEVIGRKYWDCAWWTYSQTTSHRVEEAFQRAIRGETVRFDEVIRVAQDGRITLDMMLHPVYDGDELKYVISSGVDVTDRNRARDEVAASQQFLRSSLDALSTQIAVLNEEGVILAVNDAWRAFTQHFPLSAPDVIGQNYLEMLESAGSPVGAQAVEAGNCIRRVIEGSEPMCRLEFKDQTRALDRWYQMRVTRFSGDGPLRVVVAHEDITHRIQSEQATIKRSQQLQALSAIATHLNVAQDAPAILEVIAAGARSLINARQARGIQVLSEAVDHSVAAVSLDASLPPADAQIVDFTRSGLHQIVRSGNRPLRLTQAELQAHPDWSGATEEEASPPLRGWLAAPLTGLDGRNIGLLELSDKLEGDFTADDEAILVQLAQMGSVAIENARLYHELRELDRRKDHFLATLAHELRNPLSPLTSAAQLITLDPANTSQVLDLAAIMSRQLEQLKRLIDDLLDVSRISNGKLTLKRDPVDVREAIHSALDVSRPLIEEAGHTLTVSLPAEPQFVAGDKVRLAQIVGNLIINSAKYTPRGGAVEVELLGDGGDITISVSDNGIGIPTEMLSKVFGLFTQVDSSYTRSQGGLGIGLTLVKTLVEMHGGSIEAHSAGAGQGSRFTVRIPRLAQAATATIRLPPESNQQHIGAFRILIVDDNRSAAHLLDRLLTRLGQSVRVTDSAMAALETMCEFAPQIVISDIAMPEVSGYELAAKIRAMADIDQPILIALTGYGQESDRQEALVSGFDEHFVKPMALESLRALLVRLSKEAPRSQAVT